MFVSIACVLQLADRAGDLTKHVAMVEATRAFREISGCIDEANLVKPAKPIGGPMHCIRSSIGLRNSLVDLPLLMAQRFSSCLCTGIFEVSGRWGCSSRCTA